MIKKLNFHLVYVFSFFINLLLSTSFMLQIDRRIPIRIQLDETINHILNLVLRNG